MTQNNPPFECPYCKAHAEIAVENSRKNCVENKVFEAIEIMNMAEIPDNVSGIVMIEPEWQPIETAPKDGRVVLLYPWGVAAFWVNGWLPEDYLQKELNHPTDFSDDADAVGYWYWTPENVWNGENNQEWVKTTYKAFKEYTTHWMPLPAPPKTTS